jgi:multiple antibiotic resistance protein
MLTSAFCDSRLIIVRRLKLPVLTRILSAMTNEFSLDQRKKLARKTVINCIGIFLVVLVFGNYILSYFGLDISIIRVGGGSLLAFMGWAMLNAPDAIDTTSVDPVDSDTCFKRPSIRSLFR